VAKDEVVGFDIEESFGCIFEHFTHEEHDDSGGHVELDDHTHDVMVRWLFLFCAIVSNDEHTATGTHDQKKVVAALDTLGIPKLLIFMAATKHAQTASTACDLGIELLKCSPFETATVGMIKDAEGNPIAHMQKHFYEVLISPGGYARRLFTSLKHRVVHERDHLQRLTVGEDDQEEDDEDAGGDVHDVERTPEFKTLLVMIEMLRFLCMGCYSPMQDLLYHQGDSAADHSINVLVLICEFSASLDALLTANTKGGFSIPATADDKKYPVEALVALQQKEDEIAMITEIYKLLTESVSGPNPRNQSVLIDQKACTPIINILRFMQSGMDETWESIDDNVTDVVEDLGDWMENYSVDVPHDGICVQKDGVDEHDALSSHELEQVVRLAELLEILDIIDEECESSVLSFLHALLEGRNPGHSMYDFVVEQLLKDCDLQLMDSWSNGTIFQNMASHAKAHKEKAPRVVNEGVNMIGHHIVTDFETSLDYHMLLANLTTGSFKYGPDIGKALNKWDHVYVPLLSFISVSVVHDVCLAFSNGRIPCLRLVA
jgi:hypothetical protein